MHCEISFIIQKKLISILKLHQKFDFLSLNYFLKKSVEIWKRDWKIMSQFPRIIIRTLTFHFKPYNTNCRGKVPRSYNGPWAPYKIRPRLRRRCRYQKGSWPNSYGPKTV